jgi:Galactose oxidase, central domain
MKPTTVRTISAASAGLFAPLILPACGGHTLASEASAPNPDDAAPDELASDDVAGGDAAMGTGRVVLSKAGFTRTDPAETWTFDGASWVKLSVAPSPPSRDGACMATLGAKVVLFGGGYIAGDAGSIDTNDTWIFDGRSWSLLRLATAPSPRYGASMANLGSEVVLFGGYSDSDGVFLNDTWTFDGTSWTQVNTANAPPARSVASMATVGPQVVLFGGSTNDSDTWLFDGTGWTQVSFSTPPPARSCASMATLGKGAVLFGGFAVGGSGLDDTWTFDGTNWSQVSTPTSPPARAIAPMASLGSEVLIFGGQENDPTPADGDNDTWTFDGTSWTRVAAANAPVDSFYSTLAFLP